MSKFADFNDSGVIIAFYDSDMHGRPGEEGSKTPLSAVPISDDDWMSYLEQPGRFIVAGGAVSAVTPWPPAAPEITPQQKLIIKLASGLAVHSTGTPTVSATYSLDGVSLGEIRNVASDVASGFGLPVDWVGYPDASGEIRPLDETTVVALYKAMRDYVARLRAVSAALAAGGSAEWPSPDATIA